MTPPPAALLRPGMVHTYEWTVPVGAGPVQGEADCLTYLYYSGVDPVKDTNSGLVGPLLVCRVGSLKKGMQVRKEFSSSHSFTYIRNTNTTTTNILLSHWTREDASNSRLSQCVTLQSDHMNMILSARQEADSGSVTSSDDCKGHQHR